MLGPGALKETPGCDVPPACQVDGAFAVIPNICLQDVPLATPS